MKNKILETHRPDYHLTHGRCIAPPHHQQGGRGCLSKMNLETLNIEEKLQIKYCVFTLSNRAIRYILAVWDFQIRIHIVKIPLEGFALQVSFQLHTALDAEHEY